MAPMSPIHVLAFWLVLGVDATYLEPNGLFRREQASESARAQSFAQSQNSFMPGTGLANTLAVNANLLQDALSLRAPRDMAAVVVFGFSKDPQRGKNYTKDDPEHIKSWAESCDRLKMSCTVIHDNTYSPEFAQKQTTDSVSFFKTNPVDDAGKYEEPDLDQLTTSDMRFIAMLNYLKSPEGANVEYGLLTDGHDVVFRRNPVKLMRAMDEAMGSHYVFGQEEWRPRISMSGNRTGDDTALNRLVPYWKACFGTDMPQEYTAGRMPNCGIIGGHRKVLIPFLERMRHWYTQIEVGSRFQMCDMLVFMRTINEDYEDRIVTGYPFHAKFKQRDPKEDAAIYHKNDAYLENP